MASAAVYAPEQMYRKSVMSAPVGVSHRNDDFAFGASFSNKPEGFSSLT